MRKVSKSSTKSIVFDSAKISKDIEAFDRVIRAVRNADDHEYSNDGYAHFATGTIAGNKIKVSYSLEVSDRDMLPRSTFRIAINNCHVWGMHSDFISEYDHQYLHYKFKQFRSYAYDSSQRRKKEAEEFLATLIES